MIPFPYLFLSSIFLQILLLERCLTQIKLWQIYGLISVWSVISFYPVFLFPFCKWEYKLYNWKLLTHVPFTATGEPGHCCRRRSCPRLKGWCDTWKSNSELVFFQIFKTSDDYSKLKIHCNFKAWIIFRHCSFSAAWGWWDRTPRFACPFLSQRGSCTAGPPHGRLMLTFLTCWIISGCCCMICRKRSLSWFKGVVLFLVLRDSCLKRYVTMWSRQEQQPVHTMVSGINSAEVNSAGVWSCWWWCGQLRDCS